MWIAPNLITLLGFIVMIANYAICVVYMPDLHIPGPKWIYFRLLNLIKASRWVFGFIQLSITSMENRRDEQIHLPRW
jgi:hypothetical protein